MVRGGWHTEQNWGYLKWIGVQLQDFYSKTEGDFKRGGGGFSSPSPSPQNQLWQGCLKGRKQSREARGRRGKAEQEETKSYNNEKNNKEVRRGVRCGAKVKGRCRGAGVQEEALHMERIGRMCQKLKRG